MPKLVILSDTHNQLNKVQVPDGDILIHCGDATMMGTLQEFSKFNYHLGQLPHKVKIFVNGNHDWLAQHNLSLARATLTNAQILMDEAVVIDDLKIYGSSWQPEFGHWAFGLKRGKALADKWALIPDDTQILITHGPPYGILDQTPREEFVGCMDLLERIGKLKALKIWCGGHIHNSRGIEQRNNITFINASVCDESYRPLNLPFVIDL